MQPTRSGRPIPGWSARKFGTASRMRRTVVAASEQRLSYTPSSDRRGRYETDGSLEHGFRSSMGPQRRPFKAPPARYLSWLREISDNSGRQADHNCIAESYLVVRGFLALFSSGGSPHALGPTRLGLRERK